ncbi:MAG: hypothetical protein AAF160_08870 [Pseudomonadota bacterium]
MFDVPESDYTFYAEPLKCGSLPVYEEPSRLGRLLGKTETDDEPPALVPLFRRRARADETLPEIAAE